MPSETDLRAAIRELAAEAHPDAAIVPSAPGRAGGDRLRTAVSALAVAACVAALATVLPLVLGGHRNGGPASGDLPEGSSLAVVGLSGRSTFTVTHVGGRYGVAFPLLHNTSDRPVTVQRVRLLDMPVGVQVVGYRALKLGSGVIALSREGTGDLGDYLRYRDVYRPGHMQVRPHSTAQFYFAADLFLTHRAVGGDISGCQIVYRTSDGGLQQQTLPCEFHLARPRK